MTCPLCGSTNPVKDAKHSFYVSSGMNEPRLTYCVVKEKVI